MNLKKVVKWTFIIIAIMVISLAVSPYLFKDSIRLQITKTINKQVHAKVRFSAVDLSLFRDFPKARITIRNLTILNEVPFKGDTLFYTEEIRAKMGLGELFKNKSESLKVTSISAINSEVNILINEKGDGNFDIVKNNGSNNGTSKDTAVSLYIQEYDIQNLQCSFTDKSSNIALRFTDLNHSGKGDFSADNLEATTKTSTKVSMNVDGINYMSNLGISLDAVVGIDFTKNTYSLRENTAMINQLPLEFNGEIKTRENGQLIDIKFKTPSSSFKNMLALIPEKYIGALDKIKTTGDFKVNGTINGILSNETIPQFNVNFETKKGMFQYNALPKAAKNIAIQTQLLNTTGKLNDTKVKVNKLAFTIDKDTFEVQGNINTIVENPKIALKASGTIALGNLAKVYPLALTEEIDGTLDIGISAAFDLKSIEKGNYNNIQNKGHLHLQHFTVESDSLANKFHIKKMKISFDENAIKLYEFDANTGTSDLHITGNLDNFYGYVFHNKTLQGNFVMKSDLFNVSDFMAPTSQTDKNTTSSAQEASFKIPNFLNCELTASAKKVMYDDLTLTNVTGKLSIENQTATLQDLSMELFGGKVSLNGLVSTKREIPQFETQFKFKGLNIADSFSEIDVLASIAPIGNAIEGKLNSTMNLSGSLTEDMTPEISSISGNLLGELLDSKVTTKKSKLLTSLSSKMKFIDISQLNLKDVKAFLSFENGKVMVKPFDLRYQDIAIKIGGNHGFDQQMNYQLQFDVPAKYFGAEVSQYISKLGSKSRNKTIPVSASISGTFAKPLVKTDMKKATSNLLNSLVKQEKEAIVNKGKTTLKNLLSGNNKKKDSTTTSKAANLLKGLFGKKKKNKR